MMTVFTASAQVQTTSGLVSGTDQEGSMAFLGIPYAKIERFMPPLPPHEHWALASVERRRRAATIIEKIFFIML